MAVSYISQIEVRKLFGGVDLRWDLVPSVNILAGANGSGKSTILNALSEMFRKGCVDLDITGRRLGEIIITFSDGRVVSSAEKFDVTGFHVDVISTFDSQLKGAEAIDKITDGQVKTHLDWELYRIQRRYLSYQLGLGKQAIAMLTKHRPEAELAEVMANRTRYFDIIDSLFAETDKVIDRQSEELMFVSGKRRLSAYNLSSGEKQLLVILTTVLIQDSAPYILVMDEPEISLHFDWQKLLIGHICSLNPNLQLLMSTHSPAVVMDGWTGHVSEMSELVVL